MASPAPSEPAEITSLMVRNVPRTITQKEFLKEMDCSGFKGLFDFCYMPRCFKTNENQGHAFVNFVSAAAAASFQSAWARQRRFGIGPDQPSLNISTAALQGLEANVRKWDTPRMRRVRNPDFLPFVLGCAPALLSGGQAPEAMTKP